MLISWILEFQRIYSLDFSQQSTSGQWAAILEFNAYIIMDHKGYSKETKWI